MTQEKELIESAKADKSEFIKLYDLHFEAIYKFLLSRVADVALAEDLTSDTFSIALEKIDSFKWTGAPFRSWLYQIAVNEMNQHFRRNKKEQKILEKEWQKVNESFSYADAELREEEDKEEHLNNLKTLNIALRNLKQEDQNLLTLRFFEDLSYQEIADILKITVNNVGVKLKRAQERLSKQCNFSIS